MVVVELEPLGVRTRVRFTHMGWGEGEEWDAVFDYFDRAWNAVILSRLVHRFERGPVDWKNPPQPLPVVASLKVALAPAPGP
jgi:hypothetical protein